MKRPDTCETLADHARHWADMVPHLETLTSQASHATSVVELGVRGGVSTWALLDGLPADGRLVSVDIDHGCLVPPRVRDDPRWTFIVGDDHAVNLPAADLVFIDTSHEYHHTRDELALAERLGAKVIILHDYMLPDVADAVDGFVRRSDWWLAVEHSDWGLAVLRR